VSRPDQVVVDRFDVANASFWLDQVAAWLVEDSHADQLAADLWPGLLDTGPPLRLILDQAAAALREALNQHYRNEEGRR